MRAVTSSPPSPASSIVPNRLANENSPYLLQHAGNPVDWYPWGEEAIASAQAQQKPIFLSVGYSACHWCHVMEHESFEDDEIAELLNTHFVSIKVDREQRPDLDQIYMTAVQLLTQRGGWPMSVFLTPQLKPFYGGTYWPRRAKLGMPGFDQVLRAVLDAWQHRRDQALSQADQLTQRIEEVTAAATGSGPLDVSLLRNAVGQLERMSDFTHGGFGSAPKFPHPMNLNVLLRAWHRWPRDGILEIVCRNLDKMAAGGIYDQLGGGFARYSVDERWLVPHFEKMLYDNALLAGSYLDGYLVTGNGDYRRIVVETCDYVLRDLTDPLGGFHSTEDADSEGVEGKFYVWSPQQVRSVLGDALGQRFCYVYDVTDEGNFEGNSILNLPKSIQQCASILGCDAQALSDEMAQARAQLVAARNQRVRPGKDDKVLVNWNGLMIEALARAGSVLQIDRFVASSARAAQFIRDQMQTETGRLWHCWRQGQPACPAYLDDYACLASALVSLYEADFQETWIDWAVQLCDTLLQHFTAPDGGFFFTADDHEQLITRTQDLHDSSVPSGSGMAATALLRLGKLTGRTDFLEAAQRTVQTATELMQQSATGAGQLLIALDMHLGPFYEIALIADQPEDLRQATESLRGEYLPNRVVAVGLGPTSSAHLRPLLQGKDTSGGSPAIYACEGFRCQQPVYGAEAAQALWQQLREAARSATP